jgi:hypothetical protein
VPIGMPPGIAGLSPKLSLHYSASEINGPVGYGWSLQGVSMITRCSNIKAVDGVGRAVDYSGNDKLCLDGQRLIQTDASGSYASLPFPQSGDALGLTSGYREYRTEKDSFARVRAYGAAGGATANGPAYFKVWTKDGQVYEYGNNANANANALVNAQGKPAVAVWAVSRLGDTQGNFIDYFYIQRDVAWGTGPSTGATPGHEWSLVEVQYTGHGSQAPANKVVLEYEDRPVAAAGTPQDRSEASHQGSKNVSIRRLKSVRTYVNWPGPGLGVQASPSGVPLVPPGTAVKVKTLKLVYDNGPSTNRSRLRQLIECAGASESACMPATTFNYAAGASEAYQINATFRNGPLSTLQMLPDGTTNYGVIAGDFNGDGRADLLRWSSNAAQNQLYLNAGGGSFNAVPAGSGTGQFNLADKVLFGGCARSFVADFNADGMTDIMYFNAAGCAGGGTSYLLRSNGDGSFAQVEIAVPDLRRVTSVDRFNCISKVNNQCLEWDINRGWTSGSTFYLLDINGDGYLDIVTTVLPSQDPGATLNPPASEDSCLVMVCTRVFMGTASGSFTEVATNLAHISIYSDPESNRFIAGQANFVADLNSDGFGDIVGVSGSYFQTSGAWMSKGDGNFEALAGSTGCYIPLDFNGDRKRDCLRAEVNVASNRLLAAGGSGTLVQTGNFNLTHAGEELFGWTSTGAIPNVGTDIIDVNGDGRQDIFRWKDDPSQNAIYLSNGDGTFTKSTTFNLTTILHSLRTSDGSATFMTADFLGNGGVEFLRMKKNPGTTSDGTRNQIYEKVNPQQADQLVSVTSGTGLTTSVYYVALANPVPSNGISAALGPRYVSDRGTPDAARYPMIDLPVSSQVVATTVADSGVGTSRFVTEYRYGGLKAAFDGRQGQGFRTSAHQGPGPDGSSLTVVTQSLQQHPYIGAPARTSTYLGAMNALPADALRTSSFVYCDKMAEAGAEAAARATGQSCPVLASKKIRQPYLSKRVDAGRELAANGGGALSTVTTLNAVDGAGNVTETLVTTDGTALGLSQPFVKATSNIYFPDDTGDERWILGRLQQAKQHNTVPNQLGSIATSFGSAPLANATQGVRAPFGVTVSPAAVSVTSTSTNAVGATAAVNTDSSATPPLSYAWSRIAGATTAIGAAGGGNVSFNATLAANQSVSETYRVTVTDATGRTGTADVPVTLALAPPVLGIGVSPNPVLANRANPGVISAAANVAVSGGVAPYAATWARLSGSRITVQGGLSASFSATLTWGESVTEGYRVTVTDAVGQSRSADLSLTFAVSPQPVVTVSPGALSLVRNNPGDVSGVLTANASGGVAPFSYAWARTAGGRGAISSSAQQNPTISASLGWGESATDTWQVTVTDSAGNSASASGSVTFGTPAQPTVSISPGSLNLSRNNPGAVSALVAANAGGGVAPYSYAWTRASGSRSVLSATTVPNPTLSATLFWNEGFSEGWQVTVTDAAGNAVSRVVGVSFSTPAQPSVSINPNPLVVNAGASGTAGGVVTAAPSGGIPPYAFNWQRTSGSRTAISNAALQNPTLSASLGWGENFSEGWLVTVTDAGGNTASSSVAATFTSPPALGVTVNPASFNDTVLTQVNKTTTVTRTSVATPSNGVGPYTYAWTVVTAGGVTLVTPTNSATGTFQASLTATTVTRSGTFRVTVTDSQGQTATANVSVVIHGQCSGANCP